MTEPTIIELPTLSATEAAKAKWWRRHHMRWSVAELAERSGYTGADIERFERGYYADGSTIDEAAWRRYRLACAGCCIDFYWDRASSQKG